jgi:hypothetical protein
VDKPSVETAPAEPESGTEEIRNDQDAIKAVEALLGSPPAAEPEKAQDEPEPVEIPGDLTSLAEKLQATPEKLYSLKVPMADGESRTLGELKDAFRTADQLRTERETFATERTQLATEKRQALQELEQIVRRLPPQTLTPDAIQAVREAHGQRLKVELEQLLETVPEWKDPVRWTAEKPLIEQYAAQFGFTPADLGELTDHRVLRVLRSAALTAKEQTAERQKPPVKVAQAPKGGKQPSQAQEWGRVKAQVTSRRMSPVAAVEQLLKGN